MITPEAISIPYLQKVATLGEVQKFVRVSDHLAGGDIGYQHEKIASLEDVPLLYDYQVGWGANDSGYLEIEERKRGQRLLLYGLSIGLAYFDEQGKLIVQPDDRLSGRRFQKQRDRYLAVLGDQRLATCEAIAPLFIAAVNNADEILWTVERTYGERPPLKKFTKFPLT